MSIIERDANDQLRFSRPIKGAHPSYQVALEKYMNSLEPFFARAQEASDFEFILTLIRVTGSQDAGWDPFETLEDVYDFFNDIKYKYKYDNRTVHFTLFLYGLIAEASEPYELLANLMNVIEGDRFRIDNFPPIKLPKGRTKDLYPSDKIRILKNRAKALGLDLSLFDEFYDNKLRNSIFHSDYTVYDGEIRTMRPVLSYSMDKWMTMMNRSIAYYEAISYLRKMYRASYESPELIDVHPDFATYPNEKATTIVRQGDGVVGVRHNWTKKELAQGHVPYRLSRLLSYERSLVDSGILLLPRNRIDKINRLINLFPTRTRPFLVKLGKVYLNGHS